MTFGWGMQDSAVNNLINCILGFEFESQITPFSVFKFVQSIVVFAFLLLESLIETKE